MNPKNTNSTIGNVISLSQILNAQSSEEEGNNELEQTRESSQVWNNFDKYFERSSKSNQLPKLPVGIYVIHATPKGFILEKTADKYEFNYKIYGLEHSLIKRVEKTFKNTNGNLGMIFNGKKGTGKTVTAKQICNKLKLPVILVTFKNDDLTTFINSIKQDVLIFIDEYEKIFEKDADMLSIMDGGLESGHRRVFVLTTNSMHINENLIERPGRLRYSKTFRDLTPSVIEEIVEDLLKYKKFKSDTIRFIASLESITIDIAKAVIQEVNIHQEPPDSFEDVFNVKKLNDKYDIEIFCEEETDYNKKHVMLFRNIKTDFHNYEDFDPTLFTNQNGYNMRIDGVGYLRLKQSIDGETFDASIDLDYFYNHNSTYYKIIEDKLFQTRFIKKRFTKNQKKPIVDFKIKISKSYSYNKNYRGWNKSDAAYDF